MIYKLISIIFFIGIAVFPQSKDTLYSLTAELGAGYSRYLTTLDNKDLNQNGFSGTVRIMWHPEHLLSLGIETGYQYLYSLKSTYNIEGFGPSEVKASMICVPIMGIYSMKVFPKTLPNLEFKFSSGVFLLYSSGEAFGDEIKSSQISIGFSGAATYLHPLNDLISIGGELKYYYVAKIQDADLSLQFVFSYKFLEY
jgi:hypothetical protein